MISPRWTSLDALGILLFATSCHGSPSPSATAAAGPDQRAARSEKPEKESDELSGSSESTSLHPVDGSPVDGSPVDGSTQTDTLPPPQDREPSLRSGRLILPVDHSFVSAPLQGVREYRHFRELSRLTVGVSHLHFSTFVNDERDILVHSQVEDVVRVYDATTGRLRSSKKLESVPLSLSAWPSRSIVSEPAASSPGVPGYFAVGSKSGLASYDAGSLHLVERWTDTPTIQLRLSPDRQLLAALTSATPLEGPSLQFFAAGEGSNVQLVGSVRVPSGTAAWDLSQDNRLLALVTRNNVAQVLDLEKGQIILEVPTQDFVSSIDLSADGRWLAVGGQGLLLVDLLEPKRRAYYSYFYNNLDTVRFSPDAQALATSSYDGHIRIFGWESTRPELQLLQVLRHDGRANVYHLEFARDGSRLLSSSGDQTVRLFGVPRDLSGSRAVPPFRTLNQWRHDLAAEGLLPAVPQAWSSSTAPSSSAPSRSPLLEKPALPSRIGPGMYSCRITKLYKFRNCKVTKLPSGHTILEFEEGHLLALRGVLYDDGPVVRYEAWLTERSSVVGCAGCEKQPLNGIFRASGGSYSGLLTFRNYFDPFREPPLPAPSSKLEDADDRFVMTLIFRSALPAGETPKKPSNPAHLEDGLFIVP